MAIVRPLLPNLIGSRPNKYKYHFSQTNVYSVEFELDQIFFRFISPRFRHVLCVVLLDSGQLYKVYFGYNIKKNQFFFPTYLLLGNYSI